MPFPSPDLSLGDPDYLITEEGMPGESGSAAARHQSKFYFLCLTDRRCCPPEENLLLLFL